VQARVPWHVLAAFFVILAAIGITVTGAGDTRTTAAIIGIFAGHSAAGFLFLRKVTKVDESERRAWTLVGVGLTVGAMGLVVTSLQFVITGDAPIFGPLDGFYLAAYVFIIAGFAALPHAAGHWLQRTRIGLDGLIGAVSIAALAWVLVLSRVVSGMGGWPLSQRIIASMYPLLDVGVIIAVMIVLLRRTTYRLDPRLVLFGIAVVLQTIGDVSVLVGATSNDLVQSEPPYIVFLAAAVAFLATAVIVDVEPGQREYADRSTPLWSLLAPYTAAVAMLVILVTRLADSNLDTGDRILLLATATVVGLIIVRQALAIRENRILVEQQRTDLVSSISHELRTPLTAMLGFLAVLHYNEVSGPDERAEMIGVVHHQANYLARIVQDLLLLADGDPGQMALTIGAVNVRRTIEHALNSTAINKDRVAVDASNDLVAHVDGERLEQVLVNLITNADRYGGDRCLIRAGAHGGALILEVHDAGPGVPKKHELLIWDRFERGPNRFNASVPGTGIGLAVVAAIAEAHGGSVGYRRSDDLGGSCFWIELPGRVDTDREASVRPLDLRQPASVAD
jgi:signal transduction histidine kinase